MLPHQSGWLAGIFYIFIRAGAPGLFLLGVLDSSFLMLPFANDVAVIVLASLHHNRFWLYAVAATLGSVVGCWIMFEIGHAGGETFIRTHVSKERFERLQKAIKRKGPVLLAMPALIPPPFPFTAFVLGAGALEVPRKPFLSMLMAMRFVRFIAESIAALYFGRRIVHWMNTPGFRWFIDGLMVIAIVGSAYSVYRLVRTTRSHDRHPAKDAAPRDAHTGTK